MWQRNVWILALGMSVACLDVATAPADHTPLASSQPLGEHLWVFHIAGGPYAAHIQLLAIGDGAVAQGRRVFRAIASRAWDGTPTNDLAGFQATADDSAGSTWTLHSSGGEILRLAYAVAGDTATGALTLVDGTRYPAFGVRFDSAAVALIAPALPRIATDSLPVVMIRLDDAVASDRDFIGRLEARGLIAELAIPTRLVASTEHVNWDELRKWRASGMGVVMHSRYHLSTGADLQHFVGETVGGFAEMAAHGLPTSVFVQPGTWRDSIYFDSPAKLRTWRGALLRTFSTVSECYAYPYWVLRADTLELGLSHVTISDGASDAQIRGWWGVALRPNHSTVLLVHTFNLKSPDQLDWFLDMVAAAKAQGSVRVVASSGDLFGAPAQVTPVSPDSTSTPEVERRVRE
jgi:hypothetical protein